MGEARSEVRGLTHGDRMGIGHTGAASWGRERQGLRSEAAYSGTGQRLGPVGLREVGLRIGVTEGGVRSPRP